MPFRALHISIIYRAMPSATILCPSGIVSLALPNEGNAIGRQYQVMMP